MFNNMVNTGKLMLSESKNSYLREMRRQTKEPIKNLSHRKTVYFRKQVLQGII